MASKAYSTPAPTQQPGLRSFIVYDRLPVGLASWPVTDNRSEPHLHAGEFVIVDPTDTEPAEGEMFLIQWRSGGEPRIARMELKHHRNGNGPFTGWWIGNVAPEQMRNLRGKKVGPAMRWADGPWPTAYARSVILGRVVGILAPAFAEPAREIA